MVHVSSYSPAITYKPVMVFIDGGYLREGFKSIFGHENINFERLSFKLLELTRYGNIVGELRRVYYYDAIFDLSDNLAEHKKQDEYFQNIRNVKLHDVKLGRLKKAKEGQRQKGVDVLISVDMLTKAFLGHYDVAIFVGGDDDFVDLINAIKDLFGKKVYGVFYPNNVSKKLRNCFDDRFELTEAYLQDCIKTL